MSEYINKIRHVCNTELMQFTLGKTEKTINCIQQDTHKWLEYLEINDDAVPGTLHIPIILTNNSLAETEQWTIRLEKELKDLNIVIVSSKIDSDYSGIIELRDHMKECDIKEIPNVIVMCTNGTRINTCIQLFKAFSHISPSPRTDINIRFDPAFDEVDKQTSLLKKFLKELNKHNFMVPDVKKNYNIPLINKILYISATLDKNFWNSLIAFGIPELENLDYILENNYPRPSHEDLVKGYKSIIDDAKLYHESNSRPVEYVREVLDSDLISFSDENIIFAPAEISISSHESMSEMFTKLGFTVLIHNGKFKGFEEPNGARTPIEVFIKNNFTDIKPQMMDTLRKWKELNPKTPLAITGLNTIERGVTFNTNGFNFTHTIISTYHAKKMNRLLQLVGRDHGHIDYCKPCIFITTKRIFKDCGDYIDRSLKLKEATIEKYNITDFSKSPSTIPIKIEINDSELLDIFINITENLKSDRSKKSKEDKLKLHNILLNNKDTEKITWIDLNNRNKIDLSKRELKTVRKYIGGKKDTRRFKQFSVNHDNRKASAQKGNSDNYSLDIACEEYIEGDFVNPKNIIWLTYRVVV
jgi:hypothetical protein